MVSLLNCKRFVHTETEMSTVFSSLVEPNIAILTISGTASNNIRVIHSIKPGWKILANPTFVMIPRDVS